MALIILSGALAILKRAPAKVAKAEAV